MNIEKFLITVLFIHQTLEIIGINRYIIKPKILSSTTIGWCFFLGLLILYYLNITHINYLVIIMLILELYNLYFLYWQFYLFGNNENKIYKYYKYYKYYNGIHRIFKESSIKLVPCSYHMVNTILYLITFVIVLINIIMDRFNLIQMIRITMNYCNIFIILYILITFIKIYMFRKSKKIKILIPLILSILIDLLIIMVKTDFSTDSFFCLILVSVIQMFAISSLWFTIIIIINCFNHCRKKESYACLICIIISILLFFTPSLNLKETYLLFEEDYTIISNEVFRIYDNENIPIGEKLLYNENFNLKKLIKNKKILKRINILVSYASTENITIASNDTIYFYQDVFSFHTKSGIAIKRNFKNLLYERDNKTKEIFKNAYFNHIINNGYTFSYNIDN